MDVARQHQDSSLGAPAWLKLGGRATSRGAHVSDAADLWWTMEGGNLGESSPRPTHVFPRLGLPPPPLAPNSRPDSPLNAASLCPSGSLSSVVTPRGRPNGKGPGEGWACRDAHCLCPLPALVHPITGARKKFESGLARTRLLCFPFFFFHCQRPPPLAHLLPGRWPPQPPRPPPPSSVPPLSAPNSAAQRSPQGIVSPPPFGASPTLLRASPLPPTSTFPFSFFLLSTHFITSTSTACPESVHRPSLPPSSLSFFRVSTTPSSCAIHHHG